MVKLRVSAFVVIYFYSIDMTYDDFDCGVIIKNALFHRTNAYAFKEVNRQISGKTRYVKTSDSGLRRTVQVRP